MKKLGSICLIILFVITLTACGSKDETPPVVKNIKKVEVSDVFANPGDEFILEDPETSHDEFSYKFVAVGNRKVEVTDNQTGKVDVFDYKIEESKNDKDLFFYSITVELFGKSKEFINHFNARANGAEWYALYTFPEQENSFVFTGVGTNAPDKNGTLSDFEKWVSERGTWVLRKLEKEN